MKKRIKMKEKVIVGICRVIENDEGCQEKVSSCGLCEKHFKSLKEGKKWGENILPKNEEVKMGKKWFDARLVEDVEVKEPTTEWIRKNFTDEPCSHDEGYLSCLSCIITLLLDRVEENEGKNGNRSR
ncbi:MAG: hypothetical protein V3V74_07775 [Nitrosomonadaceae bacterium]